MVRARMAERGVVPQREFVPCEVLDEKGAAPRDLRLVERVTATVRCGIAYTQSLLVSDMGQRIPLN